MAVSNFTSNQNDIVNNPSSNFLENVEQGPVPIRGTIKEILPPIRATNKKGSCFFQPIIVEWEYTYKRPLANDKSKYEVRVMKNQVKVSLTQNVVSRVNFSVGQKICIPYPQYLVNETKDNKTYQNITASYIEVSE